MENIRNKRILITGGTSGLGYKYAEYVLQNGAKRVALLDLPTSNGDNAVTTLQKEFGQESAIYLPCDVTKFDHFKECIKKVKDTFKGIDIMINNAGIINENNIDLCSGVNFTAVLHGSISFIELVGKQNGGPGGTLVNIASIAGLDNVYCLPIYSATKHGVVGLCKGLARSFETTGVRILCLCPGVTVTPLIHEIHPRTLPFIKQDAINEELSNYPQQPAEHVAQAMIDMLEKGVNGGIYVSENSRPLYQFVLPHYTKFASSI